MRKVILFASVSFASGILFVNIFSSIVNAVAVESNIPESVMAARAFYHTVNPGDFFKIFSPLTHILTLLSLILFWKKNSSVRLFLGIALACYVSADLFTFAYFHPRNDIMFFSEPVPDTVTLRKLASEWSSMNWIRSLVVLTGLLFSFLAVDKSFSVKSS